MVEGRLSAAREAGEYETAADSRVRLSHRSLKRTEVNLVLKESCVSPFQGLWTSPKKLRWPPTPSVLVCGHVSESATWTLRTSGSHGPCLQRPIDPETRTIRGPGTACVELDLAGVCDRNERFGVFADAFLPSVPYPVDDITAVKRHAEKLFPSCTWSLAGSCDLQVHNKYTFFADVGSIEFDKRIRLAIEISQPRTAL